MRKEQRKERIKGGRNGKKKREKMKEKEGRKEEAGRHNPSNLRVHNQIKETNGRK